MEKAQKTLVQCDFDGTVTIGDVGFMLLDAFASGDWRQWEDKYAAGEISVGRFNTEVFSMVNADKQTLLDYIKGRVVIRPGFSEFVTLCRQQDFRLVIVSNGLEFYIEQIIKDIGVPDLEIHAADTHFHPDGLRVRYIGPDGTVVDSGPKDAFANLFLADGYRVVYIGDGRSDFEPARRCHMVFAAADGGNLLSYCHRENVECQPYISFHDIVSVMETL
ncbi:MAG: MtnX-like HAD-IB family phosphatase [Dehalococcoidales bacterium]|nr:MAG: MtnX-like HAD-IB family phosphatase [Dehalococcoidales bacterium]